MIGDIKDGYLTIDSIPYIDAERLYYYGLERKNTRYKLIQIEWPPINIQEPYMPSLVSSRRHTINIP